MPSRSPAADRKHREETAGGGYFTPLAQGRYFLLTTPRPKGAPVSARVPGMVDGDRAYFRVRSRSGLVRRLRQTDRLQVTACGGLGLVSYGEPLYAAVRPLAGQEASLVAGQLAAEHPVSRRFPARLLGRTRLHYELMVS
jgi:PPOX class probable F420-dependent enzyme